MIRIELACHDTEAALRFITNLGDARWVLYPHVVDDHGSLRLTVQDPTHARYVAHEAVREGCAPHMLWRLIRGRRGLWRRHQFV